MSPTEFKAAVEKIIGIPPNRPSGEPFWWMLDTPSARLGVEIDGSRILMNFYDTEALPGLGENPATGQWNINGRDFNDDPEAVLKEFVRRLALVGYEPPKADAAESIECSSADGVTIGILDTICTMVHLLKTRQVTEAGAVGEALDDARATLQRCSLLAAPSASNAQRDADLELIHEAAGKIRSLEAGIVVSPKLLPGQIDTLVAVKKWINRIVDRAPELPASFMDNTDPTPLSKKFEQLIKDLTP